MKRAVEFLITVVVVTLVASAPAVVSVREGGRDTEPGYSVFPPYMNPLPTIDGPVWFPGEWSGAAIVDVSDTLGVVGEPDPPGTVYMFLGWGVHPVLDSVLVIGVKHLTDTTIDDEDQIGLYVDDNNDGEWDPSLYDLEGNFWTTWFRPDTLAFRVIRPPGEPSDTTWVNLAPGVELCGWEWNPISSSMDCEVMIRVTPDTLDTSFPYVNWEINAKAAVSVVGMWMYYLDAGTGDYDAVWPQNAPSGFEPADFGEIWPRFLMVELTPDTTQVQAGDDLWFSVDLEHTTPEVLTFDVWVEGYILGGAPYAGNPVIGPIELTANGIQGVYGVRRHVHIPAAAPPGGPYRLSMRAGSHPYTIWAEDFFEFAILAGESQ